MGRFDVYSSSNSIDITVWTDSALAAVKRATPKASGSGNSGGALQPRGQRAHTRQRVRKDGVVVSGPAVSSPGFDGRRDQETRIGEDVVQRLEDVDAAAIGCHLVSRVEDVAFDREAEVNSWPESFPHHEESDCSVRRTQRRVRSWESTATRDSAG